jgi:hypothetical protein
MSLNRTSIIVAIVLGLVALTIVLAGFTIPIPGTGVVTDPREIFVTLGAGLTGPMGALIIGFFAGVAEPGNISLASLIGHIAGALWMAYAYKKLVYERMQMPVRLLGWAGLIIAYYYIFVITGFSIGLALFYAGGNLVPIYTSIANGVTVEVILTMTITTLVILALPRQYQKPLW